MVAEDETPSSSPRSDDPPEGPTATSPSAEADDPLLGRLIDPYRIVRLIGRGGMGSVYEGLNTRIHKRVALKFIDARLAQSPDAVTRFQREARAASAVESPNIVQIFDAGVTGDGVPFLVMELLQGCDLGQHLREAGRLGLEPALQLTAQILKALDQAHQAGIVHRDLKPDNVFLVEREGEVAVIKLLDFGVSKIAAHEGVPLETLTKEGTVVGTPHYMSPEQAQGLADVDATTDLYSTGAILFECLAGRTPHVGGSYEQVIVRICTQDAVDVRELAGDVPDAVAAVIARALARDRADRFTSAAEMLEALLEASPEGLRDRMQSGVFRLARSGGSGGQPRGSRSSGGGARARSSDRGRVLTPTEADMVGSASTVAAPIVSSVPPADARRSRGEGPAVRSEGERTAPPSTLPTYSHQPRRARLLMAVVAGGLVAGVAVTLLAMRGGHDSPGLGADTADGSAAATSAAQGADRGPAAASATASAGPPSSDPSTSATAAEGAPSAMASAAPSDAASRPGASPKPGATGTSAAGATTATTSAASKAPPQTTATAAATGPAPTAGQLWDPDQ